LKISASITDYTWPGGTAALGGELERVARAADPMLESCTALGWIAARTERIRLGTMVAAITYRPASVLIEAVTTLDVLSGGRAWLGVGAGYHEEEARRFDLPLPPVGETEGRPFDAIEETVSTRLEPDGTIAAGLEV
jgi:alkanesulfonate monooxygenase SsuD/methylene tetrahydromethanopterin reductase-like flavin-dependent oxidoreductase (luciferase family)